MKFKDQQNQPIMRQLYAMLQYLRSYKAFLKENYNKSLRLLSFDDRDNKNFPHPSAFYTRSEDMNKDCIIKNCTQLHP